MTEWNRILHDKWYSQKEPDELVVSFTASLKKKNRKLRVLDLGCGAGRNLVYVANQGFETYGTDTSETGLNLTKEKLKAGSLKAHMVKGDMRLLPYVGNSFDAVICLFAIYHQRLGDIQTTISEIRRVLRQKSVLLVNFQSEKSSMHGEGIEVEKDTFIRQTGPEKGILHHFTDKEEIMKLLKDFKIVSIELRERKSADSYFQSRWTVVATT